MGTRLSDEEVQATVALIEEHGGYAAAARATGISVETLRARINRAARYGQLGTRPVLPGFRLAKTTTVKDKDGVVVREFIQQKPDVGEQFETPKGHTVKGVSALVDAQGNVIQQWIKTRKDALVTDLIEAIKHEFQGYNGFVPLIPPPDVVDHELMSVYPIADQHNGLLAWGRETGESYDLNIGVKRLRACMLRLVSQSPDSATGLILNLGDWQHTDDQKNMTPGHGNLLDVDSRYFKILTASVRLMMDCVELALQKHAEVEVVNIPGNHDPHASIALTVALMNAYASNPRVKVYSDPADIYFRRFGQTLLGATHGHRMKPDRMAMAMASMRREDWGATRYHWFLFGHIHHETMKEVGDVRCESFQTLASNDAFHHSSGYVAGRSLTSVTLHKERGEIGRHRVNVPPPGAK